VIFVPRTVEVDTVPDTLGLGVRADGTAAVGTEETVDVGATVSVGTGDTVEVGDAKGRAVVSGVALPACPEAVCISNGKNPP
jgi:hypothetical protein